MSGTQAIFQANWREPVRVRSSFTTAVEHSLSASEQRYGLRGKPIRSIMSLVQGTNRHQAKSLRMLLARGAVSGQSLALSSDQTRLTAMVSAGGATVQCDTTFRRITAGKSVVLFKGSESYSEVAEIKVVQSLNATSITFTTNLANDYPLGSVLAPIITANTWLKASGSVITDRYVESQVEGIEAVGTTQLEPVAALGAIPSGFASFGGLPLWVPPVDFGQQGQFGVERLGRAAVSGIDTIQTTQGDRGRSTLRLPLRLGTRADFWDVLGLFESRGGMMHSFWMASPVDEFVPTAVAGDGSTLTVEVEGPSTDWDFYPAIAVIKTDGSVVMGEVASVNRVGDEDTITFDTALGAITLAEIERVSASLRCRMASDEMEEIWHSDSIVDISLDITELLEEKDITIANLTDVTSSDLLTTFTADGACITVFNYTDEFLSSQTLSDNWTWLTAAPTGWSLTADALVPTFPNGYTNILAYAGHSTYTDCSIEVTLRDAVGASESWAISVRDALTGTGGITTGYLVRVQKATTGGSPPVTESKFTLERWNGPGLGSTILKTTPFGLLAPGFLLAAGDSVMIEVVGGRIRVYHRVAASGAFIKRLEHTDPTPLGPGKVGISAQQDSGLKFERCVIKDLR